jgi:hypothetical protein
MFYLQRISEWAMSCIYGFPKLSWGRFFVHFFPQKITFRGKFRGISWKNDFSKLFLRKIPFFPTFLGENFLRNFPRKKCTKNRPLGRNGDSKNGHLVWTKELADDSGRSEMLKLFCQDDESGWLGGKMPLWY